MLQDFNGQYITKQNKTQTEPIIITYKRHIILDTINLTYNVGTVMTTRLMNATEVCRDKIQNTVDAWNQPHSAQQYRLQLQRAQLCNNAQNFQLKKTQNKRCKRDCVR